MASIFSSERNIYIYRERENKGAVYELEVI